MSLINACLSEELASFWLSLTLMTVKTKILWYPVTSLKSHWNSTAFFGIDQCFYYLSPPKVYSKSKLNHAYYWAIADSIVLMAVMCRWPMMKKTHCRWLETKQGMTDIAITFFYRSVIVIAFKVILSRSNEHTKIAKNRESCSFALVITMVKLLSLLSRIAFVFMHCYQLSMRCIHLCVSGSHQKFYQFVLSIACDHLVV